MAEEISAEKVLPKISRRRFGAAAVAAGLTATVFAKREETVMREGLETSIATFFPLYERHDRGGLLAKKSSC